MHILLLLLLPVAVCGCTPRISQPDSPRPVKVLTAERSDRINKDFAGMATPDDAVNLAFKVPGQVLDVPVSEGDRVQRGELLAELDPRDIELQVAADRSVYEQTRSQFQRMKRLLAHEAVSQQEFEAARTLYAQARSTYENRLDMLKETKLRAPFAGIIERKVVDNFERVQAGSTVLRLVNPTTTTVKFTLPESGLKYLRNDSTTFSVEFDNYDGEHFAARLKSYVRTSTDASGFPVSLTLTGVDTTRFRIAPGMSCMVTMQSPTTSGRGVNLPLSAIYAPISGGDYVWVVDAGDRVSRRRVRLGELSGSDCVSILEGVHPGERIVTAGVYQLREGEKVRVLK